jgi:hypothetical protein
MSDKARRVLGMIFGGGIGLLYGLVSQNINLLYLPGVPLFVAPPGRSGSVILLALFGALMGLVVAWPLDAIPGVILGAILATVAQTAITIRQQTSVPGNTVGLAYVLVLTFLPRVVLLLPIAALIRWILDIWERELAHVTFSTRKLGASLAALVLISVLAGWLNLYSSDARYALQKTDQMIQTGMAAQSSEQIPVAIRTLDGFTQNAVGRYSLQLSDNPEALPIQRPPASYQTNEYAVIVRFEDGYHFACVFVPPHPEPNCGTY